MPIQFSDLKSAYKSAYNVKPYSDVHIRPKPIESQSSFSQKEKVELMEIKRWYIYYDFLNPLTGLMTRQTPRSFGVNRIKSFDEKCEKILWVKEALYRLLESGWSPYEKSTEGLLLNSAFSSFDYALSYLDESGTASRKTVSDYRSRINGFKKYLSGYGLSNAAIPQIDKKIVTAFLDSINNKSSSKNRNNTQAALSSIFSVLADRDLINRNFILDIKKAKSESVHNKPFGKELKSKIFERLEVHDPYLLSFIKVFSCQFIRPVEAVRLRVGDIDLNEMVIYLQTKTKHLKKKRIPDILIPEYIRLIGDHSNKKHSLFTPYNCSGEWNLSDDYKRDYFTKRFNKNVIDPFKLDPEYKMYGFRHTMATDVVNQLMQTHGREKSLDLMMDITGHTSRRGLMNYLKQIDAILPDDWSGYVT